MIFNEKKFSIPILKGISAKNIEEHLKLYAGYVKNANLVLEETNNLEKDMEKNAYILGELRRRFSFEYNGMRNHEVYFSTLEGSAKSFDNQSKLIESINNRWGSFDTWLASFKSMALTRGVGWAMLYYDNKDKQLLNSWVDEQHFGQLNGCQTILALDMWEHAFVADYQSSGKKKYVDDFFENINWSIVEENFNVVTLY